MKDQREALRQELIRITRNATHAPDQARHLDDIAALNAALANLDKASPQELAELAKLLNIQ